MSMRRTRARYRRIPQTMRRMSGGRSGGTGGGGQSAPDLNLYGLTSFSASNYLATASGGGEVGISTGFGGAVLFRVPQKGAATSSNRVIVENLATGGWYVVLDTANASITVGTVNGSAGSVTVAAYTLTASDYGRIMCVTYAITGSVLRVVVNRTALADVACVGYTGPTARGMSTGNRAPTADRPAPDLDYLASVNFRGVPTAQQMIDYCDQARARGDLPETFAGVSVTHRHSVKDELFRTIVTNGQAAPTQLTDTQTRATADALIKAGSPTVRIIDPTIEGRRVLGAQGFSTSNYLQTAASGGVRGSASGFWLHLLIRPDASAGLAGLAFAGTGASGYQLYWALSSGVVSFNVVGSTNVTIASPASTVAAGDFGQLQQIQAVYDGAALSLYYKRVLVASGAVSGYTANAIGMSLLAAGNGTIPATTASLFGFQGGDGYVPTLAELQQAYDDTAATGRIQPIPGKTTHRYDLTADILASGVDAVPATVLDRIGTDHLSKLGIAVQTDANSIRGIGPYGAADGWQTAPGGGIQGASSYHAVIDVWLTAIPTTTGQLFMGCTATGNPGWYLQVVAGGGIRVTHGGFGSTSAYTLTSGDLNKRLRLTVRYDGGSLKFYVQGVQVGADTVLGFTAVATAAMKVGMFSATESLATGYIECVVGGNAAASAANVATYNADLTLPPPTISGVTLKRWVFEQDIAAVSGALPSKSVERISGNDDLVRVGSPLVLAQRTERVWSYETASVMYGASSFTDTDAYSSATGLLTAASGWWGCAALRVDSQAVVSLSRVLLSSTDGGSGHYIRVAGTNTSITWVVSDGAGAMQVPGSIVLSATDVGKQILLFGCWDGAKMHVYGKRAESGSGLAITGHKTVAGGVTRYYGRYSPATGNAASGLTLLGVMGGLSIVSAAEVFAAHDAFVAADDLVAIPGKTDYLQSMKLDAQGNGGVLPSALLDRITNTTMLSRIGAPTTAPIFARAAGW